MGSVRLGFMDGEGDAGLDIVSVVMRKRDGFGMKIQI